MKGVQFLVDEDGHPKSIVLDLDYWDEIWEDFYFGILATEALEEGPTLPWEEVKAELDAELEQEKIKAGTLVDD